MTGRPQVQVDADRAARSAVNEKLSAIRDRAVKTAKRSNEDELEDTKPGTPLHINHGNRMGRRNGLQAVLEWLPQFADQIEKEMLAIESGAEA